MCFRVVLCIALWILSQASYADTLSQQREWFERAELIAASPGSSEYKMLVKKLADYPLLPYVEQKTLINYPYLSNQKRIARFLDKYEDTPLDAPLRKKWLTYLKNKNQKALFLHFYRDLGDTALRCTELKYRLEDQKQSKQILDEIDDLWLTGQSLPSACDPVLAVWRKAGRLTHEAVWQRMILAGDGGNHTLLPYLKKLLPKKEQYLGDLWLKVRRSPSYVSRPSMFPGTFPKKEAEILSYGLGRLIWHDRDLALASWQKLADKFAFSDEQKQHITEKFAISLALANHEKAGEWLELADKHFNNEEILRWHLAYLLRQKNWQRVLDIINAAPTKLISDYSYHYWQGRGLEELDASEQAHQKFFELANKRHYYGFLASGKLRSKPSLSDAPLMYDAQQLSQVANKTAAVRAREFLALKRTVDARREWIYLQSTLSHEQNLMAAVIADSWGWHDQAIFTFSRVGYLDDVKRRFPLAFKDQMVTTAEDHNVDPAWAFAIARRESSFMSDANSSVGARGLMQLMPGTARYLAKKKISSSTLFDPDTNVSYGTQYMRYLMDKLGNNQVLATAAYNAGWRRVKDWLPEDQSIPADVWVETIPYKETRNYVKAVMAYKQIYLRLLGDDRNLFTDLAKMQISPRQSTL
ncbi:lytic transglycosylase domain-containing protein [Neptunicella marina]|uniref:Lytic transglycosylase domain-containing protein n=1 Tax=Neptunicella marina TaxID=2125989 RepID=A0A8J6ISZ1_9ALTE|nr:lytic transglycosylase domain-containing protein [Neptunicella marina]MBC3765734.1 lytic transglycosylase domain-containing protein [Neptunicella marina]